MVGGFAFANSGGLILCTNRGVYKLDNPDTRPELLHALPFDENERCNDITTDPRGRMYVGTLKSTHREGSLYLLEKGKEPVALLKNVGISNGMCFSLDHQYFYHTDSSLRIITRYNYSLSTGSISHAHVIYQGSEENGFPDGICMDSTGNIWVACWGGSKILRISSEGRIVEDIPTPPQQPSSLTFGGPELRTLYITSACEGGVDFTHGHNAEGEYLGGHLYGVETEVSGMLEYNAAY